MEREFVILEILVYPNRCTWTYTMERQKRTIDTNQPFVILMDTANGKKNLLEI